MELHVLTASFHGTHVIGSFPAESFSVLSEECRGRTSVRYIGFAEHVLIQFFVKRMSLLYSLRNASHLDLQFGKTLVV